jgi:hypothetical protein
MMNSKRLYYVLFAVLVLLGGGGIAGAVFGNKLLTQKSERLTQLKVEYAALEEQQKALIQAKKDIEKYTELEGITKAIVPQEKDQARTVREIIQLADQSGVKIGAITFPSSTLGQIAPKAAAPASGETTTTAAPTTAASSTTQVKAVDGIAGLYQMEVNVQGQAGQRVTYQQFIGFLKRLEQSRRTSQVNSITITPNTTDRNIVTFNLIINVYLKP